MSESKRLDFQRAKERITQALAAMESGMRTPEQAEAIFRRRAELLARADHQGTAASGEAILIFRLGPARYALPIASVSEVIAHPLIAPVPGGTAEIAGLIQVRGEIRALWNLMQRLGLQANQPQQSRSALLIRTSDGESGILVDEVEDIRIISAEQQQKPPDDSPHGLWMTNDFILVLDIERLLTLEHSAE